MVNRDLLFAWLNDAYAMEIQLVPVLENHASHFVEHQAAQVRIRQHVQETQRHAERMKQCISRLNARPSVTKSALATLMGSAEAIPSSVFRDELVKIAIAGYAAEQFEVACYKALMLAAREAGETEIALACEQNMREDEAMALWLDSQLPAVVSDIVRTVATRR